MGPVSVAYKLQKPQTSMYALILHRGDLKWICLQTGDSGRIFKTCVIILVDALVHLDVLSPEDPSQCIKVYI